MSNIHSTAYTELQSMYDELQSYLDSVLLGPENEILLRQCEHLGDLIYRYNVAILEKNSKLHAIKQTSIIELTKQAREAKEALRKAEEQLKIFAQVAKTLDKILAQLG